MDTNTTDLTDDELRMLLLSYALKEASERLAKVSSISVVDDDWLDAEVRVLSESETYVSLLREVAKLLYDRDGKYQKHLDWEIDQLREAIPQINRPDLWSWHND